MDEAADNVLIFSLAESAVKTSRLERSNRAQFTTVQHIVDFCTEHNIPYALDFKKDVLPTQTLQEVFAKNYALQYLPPTTLQHKGVSTIIALESKNLNDAPNYHGEVISTISGFVGQQLQPGVDVIYIKTDPNPAYREEYAKHIKRPLEWLLENQGVPVVFSCVGWDDACLTFDHVAQGQFDHFWKVTGFVVDSAGNNGRYGPDGTLAFPTQKHRASSHAPPLTVSVGAVEYTKDGMVIAGYSSISSPTFLAPVANNAKIIWKPSKEPEDIIGTSAACPYVGGVLAALNGRYGPYLTREQILYALIATCEKVTKVAAFSKHTPQAYTIDYKPNAAGLTYNAGAGGFGLINPHKADHLLAHMVAMSQHAPDLITVPTEERVELVVEAGAHQKDAKGNYCYDIELPRGYALKTTVEVEYVGMHGQVTITSPSGTKFPMVTSMLPILNIQALTEEKAYYGLSTSHAWTGENMEGKWRITSATPIHRLRFSNHHFLEGDIIHNLDVDGLLRTPVPDLSNAIPLIDLKPTLRVRNHVAAKPREAMAAAM